MAKKSATKPSGQAAKIYIVDDHPVFREGLAGIIRQNPDLTVCGTADTAAKALDDIPRLKPDILLTDIGLPGRSGLDLLKDLRVLQPSLPVLVVSMHDEILYAERVLHAGARGYVMKSEGPEKILQAIAKVLAGHVHVSEMLSGEILERLSRPALKPRSSPIGSLSDREFEILRLIGEGKDSHQIARDLHLSIKTVHCHRANIREKLGLKSAAGIIHFATRWVSENVQ